MLAFLRLFFMPKLFNLILGEHFKPYLRVVCIFQETLYFMSERTLVTQVETVLIYAYCYPLSILDNLPVYFIFVSRKYD